MVSPLLPKFLPTFLPTLIQLLPVSNYKMNRFVLRNNNFKM